MTICLFEEAYLYLSRASVLNDSSRWFPKQNLFLCSILFSDTSAILCIIGVFRMLVSGTKSLFIYFYSRCSRLYFLTKPIKKQDFFFILNNQNKILYIEYIGAYICCKIFILYSLQSFYGYIFKQYYCNTNHYYVFDFNDY